MPHIQLEDHLPGVTGLLEFRKDTAEPLRQLTEILLRGSSTLTPGERELIATIVSYRNKCVYCATSHTAFADAYLGDNSTSDLMKQSIDLMDISDKMKSLLKIAEQVQISGKNVTNELVENAKKAGVSDMELHDTVMIAALFSFYNRYVDGLATFAPSDPKYYSDMAQRIKENGYYRPKDGYEFMKENQAK